MLALIMGATPGSHRFCIARFITASMQNTAGIAIYLDAAHGIKQARYVTVKVVDTTVTMQTRRPGGHLFIVLHTIKLPELLHCF
jgi:hypothetical protein